MVGAAGSDVPGAVAIEVRSLLDDLGASRCEFYRNGSWYDAAAAKKHLEKKYRYLADHSMIGSTEDFIRLGGTASSVSGQPYQVRCNGRTLTSRAWLEQQLIVVRSNRR
jgi:hypothetical protein